MSTILETLTQRLAALAALALIAGCSSAGDGNADSSAAASPPRIEGLSAIVLDQDTESGPQKLALIDADTDASLLDLTVVSSDAALLPPSGLKLSGAGSERSLIVVPAAEATGTATLTLTVRDSSGLGTSSTIEVRVNPVFASFRSLANEAFGSAPDGSVSKVAGVTVQGDVDDDPQAFDALIAAGEQ